MRSLTERIVHTGSFEAIAVAIMTPAFALATGASMAAGGTLSVLISLGAVIANVLWTFVFDRLVPTRRRTLVQRVLQAAVLEILVALYTIPLTMGITGASFATAHGLDAAALVFFHVYGVAFNAAFDAVMRLIERRRAAQALSR